MITALWVVQILLAFVFFTVGAMKLFRENKAKEIMLWARDVSKSYLIFVGWIEILGAIGLILPQALGILPVLTLLSAIGIMMIMILAAMLHARRKEKGVGINIFFLILALFVVIGHMLIN
ncbi:DoxX family protein [Paenibacillus sp. GCM10012307]|uniref:DoxX family protein n=1 Tax=Paenibacillus roseus TaxID=2798579 RepID=A0A934MJL2_9BACL|nr:DoxX family protein [Paenibacillus roseus]MBJ6360040.1 DoxX family protein [Paenibacillus roseus]